VADHDLLAELVGLRTEHHNQTLYGRPERADLVAEQISRVEAELRTEVEALEAEAAQTAEDGADIRAGELREEAARLRAGLAGSDTPAAGGLENAADKTPREKATPRKRTG
jgi:cell division protein FtsB